MAKTALYAAHEATGARFTDFAGYTMPVQYSDGILKEHLWVRKNAGIFDVSHMGQVILEGESVADFLSYITPSAFETLAQGKAKYTVLTNETGGIIDDLIITRMDEKRFFLVINAGCKAKDIAWIKKHLPDSLTFTELSDRSLIAVQGPKAQAVLDRLIPGANLAEQKYMTMQHFTACDGTELFISRLGYTGEDGFEISIPSTAAEALWNKLLEQEEVKPIGLGARDTLRLEMGYPLYGHDLTEEISPVEASLSWVISPNNTSYLGAQRIIEEREKGTRTKRVGIRLTDKGIAREGANLLNENGEIIGTLTSGGFGPSVDQAIGQGYIERQCSAPGTKIAIELRGRKISAEVSPLTFLKAKTK